MMKNQKLNEATLENRISTIIENMFPALNAVNVEHQKSFTIKFGRHNILINGTQPKKDYALARLDILVTIDGENAILLELKKEGHKLTNEDKIQGLSYARLLDPIPPITLISNGVDNLIFDSFTKKEIEPSINKDITFFKNLIDQNFSIALNKRKNILNKLLAKDNILFSRILNQLSNDKLLNSSGSIIDFTKPIVTDYQIKRTLIEEIKNAFHSDTSIVGVIGSSFSGKTSLLYQFFEEQKSDDSFILYINCMDSNYSVFKPLAFEFTKNLNYYIDENKIREWITLSLIQNEEASFYLLIDNFNDDIPENIKNELLELIDIFSSNNSYVIYTIDEYNYKELMFQKERNYLTNLGFKSKFMTLKPFCDQEFSIAKKTIREKYNIIFEEGSKFNLQYREPRILRYLISSQIDKIVKNKFTKINSVLDINFFNLLIGNKHYNFEIKDLYKKLAFCFLQDCENRKKVPELNIMAKVTGVVTKEIFKLNFPDDLPKLLKSSLISKRVINSDIEVIVPKIPELLSYYVSSYIANNIATELKKGTEINSEFFLKLVTVLPFDDIVGAITLLKLLEDENNHMNILELIGELSILPPEKQSIDQGTKVVAYTQKYGHLNIDFNDLNLSEFGEFIKNSEPYLILSQFLMFPFSLEVNDSNELNLSLYFSLLEKVASSKLMITSIENNSLEHSSPISMRNYEDYQLVDPNEGIVEIIVECLKKNIIEYPNEMITILQKAIDEDNLVLVWRMCIAVQSLSDIDSEIVLKNLTKFKEIYHIYLTNKIE